MMWGIGVILIFLYRAFNAGMKSDTLFYSDKEVWSTKYRAKVVESKLDGEKLFFYTLITFGVGITWPISLPVISSYLLGKRYAK